MNESKDLIFKNMREASEYFGFAYDIKANKRNDEYLSCYCKWERISRKFIKIIEIYKVPKERQKKKSNNYKHNVGDIISNKNSSIEILKQIRINKTKTIRGNKKTISEKGYLVKCVKDGYEFEIFEYEISSGYGCPVCTNRKVIKGINDIATTRPEIAKLFLHHEEAYTLSYSSGKKVQIKCPRCGAIKWDTPNHINHFGFSCPNCSDGISYPNKFMAKLLQELHIDFEREVIFDWCKYPCYVDKNLLDYGSYDFVIRDHNLIIEMDGGIGHGNMTIVSDTEKRRNLSLDETIYRDKNKNILAQQNGYKIIRIDCFYKDIKDRFDLIVDNIKRSELSYIFDMSKIDYDNINQYCINNSYIIDASELWNQGMTTREISIQLKISKGTISDYLQIAAKQNLCDYDINKSIARSYKHSNKRSPYMVKYDNRKEVFSSMTELLNYYANNYNIKLVDYTIRQKVIDGTTYYDREFIKLSQKEFNDYKNSNLVDLVVGEAFLIT